MPDQAPGRDEVRRYGIDGDGTLYGRDDGIVVMHSDYARLRAERDGLIECLADVIGQACYREPDGMLDSSAISAYTDAMLKLADYGLVEIQDGHGRRCLGRMVKL